MATKQHGTTLGPFTVIDKRQTGTAATSPISATTYAAVRDNSTLDTALAAANGTYWTQARLDKTCLTDKIYAIRLINDSAGIS